MKERLLTEKNFGGGVRSWHFSNQWRQRDDTQQYTFSGEIQLLLARIVDRREGRIWRRGSLPWLRFWLKIESCAHLILGQNEKDLPGHMPTGLSSINAFYSMNVSGRANLVAVACSLSSIPCNQI